MIPSYLHLRQRSAESRLQQPQRAADLVREEEAGQRTVRHPSEAVVVQIRARRFVAEAQVGQEGVEEGDRHSHERQHHVPDDAILPSLGRRRRSLRPVDLADDFGGDHDLVIAVVVVAEQVIEKAVQHDGRRRRPSDDGSAAVEGGCRF